jgi:hypothetical protein
MPGPWISTPLIAGPLANNCYCVTIPGLSASTCYEYRSVFMVSGTCYYGNILTGVTQPMTMSIPSVTTGIAPYPATTSGYLTCCHTVDNNGNLTIQEYGILYTANPSYRSVSTLIYPNVGSNVFKAPPVCANIATGVTYSAMTTGLPSGSVTYYRAFAVNALGAGYGCIYSKITASPPPYMLKLCHISPPPSGWCSDGTLHLSPSIIPDPEWIKIEFTVNHTVCGTCGAGTTMVYCKPNGSPSYCPSPIFCAQTMAIPSGFICHNYDCCITIYCGDALCYSNMNTATHCGSCAQFTLFGATTSGIITACIDHTNYECYNDRVAF